MAKEDGKQIGDEEAVEQAEADELEGLDDIESLRKAYFEEREKAEKYLASWQRAEADFMNYKKRSEQERTEVGDVVNAALIKDLLPVLDDLERALENVPEGMDEPTWVEGIELIYRKLKSTLEDRGLSEIASVGEEFDPNIHEAVMCVEGEEGKVCEEIQRGYMFRDKLLRPSMVNVGKEEAGD